MNLACISPRNKFKKWLIISEIFYLILCTFSIAVYILKYKSNTPEKSQIWFGHIAYDRF